VANFTDLYIKRPVLAIVVSLLIFIFGLHSLMSLQVSQFPQMKNTVITVTTAYPGASASVVQGFITSPIEKLVASADGVDYITSESKEGVSIITAYIRLNYDPTEAFTSVMSQVTQASAQLPKDAQSSVIKKNTGAQLALMYIGLNSNSMSAEQITDYVNRVVKPQLQKVPGVSDVEILGSKTYAMRIWLNPERMAALNITANEVANALREKNFVSAAGQTKGVMIAYNISANTDLSTPEEFQNIVIKSENGSLVTLKNIATVDLGAQNYDSKVTFNGKSAIFLAISASPNANPLTMISNLRAELPQLKKQFPPSLSASIVYDVSDFIRASIHEVMRTIIEACLIVILVIFLFLGSFRSVIIPVVTIPLSLIGVASLMLLLGFSINLLTLLAMVLAIGLVVDDAIVVVENIHRHMEEGLSPFNAALKGASEIATPIIVMTITLAAVYAPIGFMGGITGALFKEFAFTLAAAVIISGVIALTLSPMMCSKLLNQQTLHGDFAKFIDSKFDRLKEKYQKILHSVLDYRPMMVVLAATILISCYFLYISTQEELAPVEDQSALFVMGMAPQYANIDYSIKFSNPLNKIFESFPAMQDDFIIAGTDSANTIISGMILKPWNKRKQSQFQIQPLLQQKISQLAGLQTVAFPMPSLPVSGSDIPIQFVIQTTSSYATLYQLTRTILSAAKKSGLFVYADNSLRFDNPEITINVDRNKAADIGVSMADIGTALSTSLGGNYVNYFNLQGQSYQVIPQLLRSLRMDPQQLEQIYVATRSGATVPLSTVAVLKEDVQPNSLSHFQQLNSATIQAVMTPGKTVSDGLNFLKNEANKVLPNGFSVDYAGQSRQFIQEGNTLIYTFFFAIMIIFLVLAAQFESFRDPWIILICVPMSICGALIPLNLGLATINIYTQVGLVTLIGLISKHGILMVDFANRLQIDEGLPIRAAIEKAAAIRLRPILMTTAAMVVGLVPLLLASGAGAVSRFDIGLVIVAGMLIGTFFTLFVVPTAYTFIATKKNLVSQK
jgi:multidrug efflux pump